MVHALLSLPVPDTQVRFEVALAGMAHIARMMALATHLSRRPFIAERSMS
jgi:hypothetical protein